MTVDYVDKEWTIDVPDLPWTLEKIGDIKRSLSARANNARSRNKLDLLERQDMARLYDLVDLADRKQRERDNLVPPGPRPEWVRKALDHR